MSKAKMEAARELVREKQYTQARELLKTIDHPTARKWLIQLDTIAPEREPDFDDLPTPPPKPRSLWRVIRFPLLLLLIAAFAVVYISFRQSYDTRYTASKRALDERAIHIRLRVYCESDTGGSEAECDQTAALIMAGARQDIDVCFEQYPDLEASRLDCLIERGVIPRR